MNYIVVNYYLPNLRQVKKFYLVLIVLSFCEKHKQNFKWIKFNRSVVLALNSIFHQVLACMFVGCFNLFNAIILLSLHTMNLNSAIIYHYVKFCMLPIKIKKFDHFLKFKTWYWIITLMKLILQTMRNVRSLLFYIKVKKKTCKKHFYF